ncbi:MAG: ISNCY family transposase [Chloroflexota bacterium]
MEERTRALVLSRVVAGRLTIPEAALLLGLSERSVWRLKSRFLAADLDAAALAHGNAGRVAAHRLDAALADRVVAFARDGYAGINDTHLGELLAEREGITLSRSSIRRILRAAGIASPRQRRAPTYRSRRERRAAAGMLVQLDASRHRWFGAAASFASLHSAIDDATGVVLAACFREQEDAAGYFRILGEILAARGVPLAVYSDRHGVFWRSPREREAIEEELLGQRQPTQFGRALAECGIELILANSPQAKGRVERLFGTFQDRLVAELRLAGVGDIAAANRFLVEYLPRHNSRFAITAADPEAAWRALPKGLSIESICCFKYNRIVAGDNTVRLDGVVLQLPARIRGSWSNLRVELRQYLDGSFSVHAPGGRELARSAVPAVPPTLRAREWSRAPIGGVTPLPRNVDRSHPWRRYAPGGLRGRPPLTEYPNR